MSVQSHLSLSLDEYDRVIRTYIPYYEELVAETAAAIASASRPIRTIVECGIGTGALTLASIGTLPRPARARLRVVGIDADAGMLGMARRRVGRRLGDRLTLVHGSFTAVALPKADAIVGTYALHHIRETRAKLAFYRACFAALSPGGVLISGDSMPACTPAGFARDLEVWYRHLGRTYGRAEGKRIYASWADEDTYLPLATEMQLLAKAGFEVDVPWRRSPFAVICASKP
ncbi:MAG: class I SAM-dependent methyltransferase [Vicinamibacterales bacterium]